MLSVIRYILVAVGMVVAVARAAERDFVRTFDVQPGCTLAIDTYRGAINVTEADTNTIRVAVHLEIGADSESDAERLLKGFTLDFTQSANAIAVVARHPAETRARFVWHENEQIEPTFRVTVPRRCNVNLKTISGSVIVGNLAGELSAETETGDVFFRHVTGMVTAATKQGDVVVSHCDGSVTARVLAGTIRIGTVTGRCDLKNSSGAVEVLAAKSDVHAYAEAGDANIGVPRDFSGNADVTTSGGNIVVKMDPAASCAVEASTSLFGHVESRVPLAIDAGRRGGRKLVGHLNRGGAKLLLKASGGNVRIEPGEALFE